MIQLNWPFKKQLFNAGVTLYHRQFSSRSNKIISFIFGPSSIIIGNIRNKTRLKVVCTSEGGLSVADGPCR